MPPPERRDTPAARTFMESTPPMRLRVAASLAVLLLLSCTVRPPRESGDFLPSDLVELTDLDSTLKLDIRYAGTDNFMGRPMYAQARAFLQRPAAEALVQVHRDLAAQGYGLVVFDGYRPWRVTKDFWDSTPKEKRHFVADPRQGSRHNRGCAADVTLYVLSTGEAVEMTGDYDEMTERSYPEYAGGTAEQRRLRDLLIRSMERRGFRVYPYEWWHFDFQGWERYRIQDIPFERLD